MAKKVEGYIKLQIPAGKATPAPPVGPALGQHGVNIVEFTKQFNARTADQGDLIIPVVITVYADRSFSFVTKTPPAAVLLKKAPEGTGVIAGGPARSVLEMAGIKNIRTKSLGSNNKQNVVLATISGLSQIKAPEEVAKNRGKSVEEVLA